MSTADAALDEYDDLPDFTEPPVLSSPHPKELKRLIKDWRSGRATRKLMEAFHDAYIALIGALMIGGALVNVVLKAQKVVAQCTADSCLSARAVLPWAGFAVAVAAALVISRLFGPVLASAAEGFWLLDAPIQRAQLLRARLVAVVAGSAVGGAAVGALITALTGSDLRAVLVWAGATGLCSGAAVAFAAAQQGAERHRMTRILSFFFGAIGVLALLTVISVAAGWLQFSMSELAAVELAIVLAGIGLLGLIVSGILANVRLSQIRRTRLLSGGALVSGLSGAFFALDLGLARDIVVERRAMEVGHVKPKRGRKLGVNALIWREFERLMRFPQPLVAIVATLVVPYAADALGMSALTPVFGALALFGATIPLLGGLRVLTRTGGLARALPFSPSAIKLASVAVPAVIAGIWAILTTAAYTGFGDGSVDRSIPEAFFMAVATAAAGMLGAVRWTTAKNVDFSKPMVSTQAGAIPPGLMLNLFRGFDVCILTTAPMLLGFSPLFSLIIAGIAALILFGNFNADAMRAKQEEQQRLLDAQRAERAKVAAAAKQKKR